MRLAWLGVNDLAPYPSVGVLDVPDAPDHSPFRGDHLDLLSELSHFFLSVPTRSFTWSLPCDQWSMSRPNSSLAPKNSKITSFSSLSQVECSSEEHRAPAGIEPAEPRFAAPTERHLFARLLAWSGNALGGSLTA